MFQMIDEERPTPEDRKAFVYKIGVFVAAMGGVGVVIYFLVTSNYLKG
ncbi:MAG TPA: hypothetical protein VGX94_19620 [Terriglobia bacterium]|nr:hypothetical protein [Terriglobia bacterium]